MKKILFTIMLILPIALIAQNDSYFLKGKVGNVNAPAKVYLTYRTAIATVVDSISILNGQFEFKGSIVEPTQALLVLNYKGTGIRSRSSQSIAFYLESGKINVNSSDSIINATIKGSKANADNEKLKEALKPCIKKINAFMSEYNALSAEQKRDKEVMADRTKLYKLLTDEQQQVNLNFIKENSNSFVSLATLKKIGGSMPVYSFVAPLFNSLSPNIKNSVSGKEYAKGLEVMKTTAIGSMAPLFTQNDPNGKPIALSSFNGKFVLVDFWASWCGPCRAENPNVVKAYNKYHDKGLEILGVSLDDEKSKEAWLAAIQKDGLIWNHVSDLKGWKNEAAELYGVKAIPQNVLLDKTGKIIGKNLRGEDLDKKLEEIFK